MNDSTVFCPPITTLAGSTLTAANWQAVGISTVSCALDQLLMKPGLDYLNEITTLGHYIGWEYATILNASMLQFENDAFKVRSSYDGGQISLSKQALISLINHLKPTILLLPVNIGLENATRIFPHVKEIYFSCLDEKRDINHVYIPFLGDAFDDYLLSLKQYDQARIYALGELTPTMAVRLSESRVNYIESNLPAADAVAGLVYDGQTTFNILDENLALVVDPLTWDCTCPTCTMPFSRSYLHHLYVQTPLLCQRLLIQHNVFHTKKTINNRFAAFTEE